MSDTPIQQLRDDSATIRKLATERLDTLRDPVLALLSTIDTAIGFMARREADVDRRFALQLPAHEAGARAAAKERLARSMAAPKDRTASELSHVANFLRERQAEMIHEDSQKNASAAAKVAAKVLTAAGALEDEVAKLALRSSSLGAATRAAASMTLQELLGEQRVVADLEARTVAELRDHWHALMRVDPTAAEKLEPMLGRIARDRANEVTARTKAQQSARGRDGTFTDEANLARLLLSELEAARQARLPADLAVFTAEVKPMLGSLLRRSVGIDPRSCSAADLERYVQRWKPGARLDQLPVLDGWPLRFRRVTAAVTPQPLAPMPARFGAAG